MQQDNADHSETLWPHGSPYGLIGDEGQRAVATLLAAGWPVLASFAADTEGVAGLRQHLNQALERLREEIARAPAVIDSLLGLASQLLSADRLLPPLPPGFMQSPGALYPRLGPLQKEQARWEALRETLNDYRTAVVRYTQRLSELFEAALGEYQQELAVGTPDRSAALGARELHDRWIQVAERTYERFLHSEEYTQAIAGLMNAWAELRLALQPVLDELLQHLGLPSRHDVEDTQLHLDQLRREQRADSKRLQREVRALRHELAELRGQTPPTPRSDAQRDQRS